MRLIWNSLKCWFWGILSYIWRRAYVGLVLQYSRSNVVRIILEILFLKRLLKGLFFPSLIVLSITLSFYIPPYYCSVLWPCRCCCFHHHHCCCCCCRRLHHYHYHYHHFFFGFFYYFFVILVMLLQFLLMFLYLMFLFIILVLIIPIILINPLYNHHHIHIGIIKHQICFISSFVRFQLLVGWIYFVSRTEKWNQIRDNDCWCIFIWVLSSHHHRDGCPCRCCCLLLLITFDRLSIGVRVLLSRLIWTICRCGLWSSNRSQPIFNAVPPVIGWKQPWLPPLTLI